jgi:hypothetical protein
MSLKLGDEGMSFQKRKRYRLLPNIGSRLPAPAGHAGNGYTLYDQ